MPVRDQIPVTVADIYGRPVGSLSTQLGRREQFTDFRMIGRGEHNVRYMRVDGRVEDYDPNSTFHFGGPRLIVGKVTLKKYTFTETGVERAPRAGEYYINPDGVVTLARTGAALPAEPMMIMTREVVEIP